MNNYNELKNIKEDFTEIKQKEFENIILNGSIEDIRLFLLEHFHDIKHTISFCLLIDRLERERQEHDKALADKLPSYVQKLYDFLVNKSYHKACKCQNELITEILKKLKEWQSAGLVEMKK
jgi:hypothetical protein